MTGTWATGWATGDMETAAELKKGIGAIADSTLGGSAASVDMTSIVATYAHLLVVTYARGDAAAGSTNVLLRFNGDSGSNYDYQRLQGAGASTSAAEAFAQSTMQLASCPAATAGANLFGVSAIFIPHYAGSSNNKVALSISAQKNSTSSGGLQNYLFGGFWRSSAAINRITLLPTSGNFVAGTRVTIYGMGA